MIAGAATPEGSSGRHRPVWLEVLCGIVLVVLIWVAFRSTNPDNLGRCDFQTGYERQTGSALVAPALLGLVGVIGIAVASHRAPAREYRLLALLAILSSRCTLLRSRPS